MKSIIIILFFINSIIQAQSLKIYSKSENEIYAYLDHKKLKLNTIEGIWLVSCTYHYSDGTSDKEQFFSRVAIVKDHNQFIEITLSDTTENPIISGSISANFKILEHGEPLQREYNIVGREYDIDGEAEDAIFKLDNNFSLIGKCKYLAEDNSWTEWFYTKIYPKVNDIIKENKKKTEKSEISGNIDLWYPCIDEYNHWGDDCIDKVKILFKNNSNSHISQITFKLTIKSSYTTIYKKKHTINVDIDPDEVIPYDLRLSGKINGYYGQTIDDLIDEIEIISVK